MKEYKITLDLVQTTKNEPIYLKNDDVDSVKFLFEVLNNGEVHDLTGTTSVRLAVQRPSGFSFFQDCAITDTENGLCEVTLTTEAYAEIGLNLGELYVTQNGIVQVTRQFEFSALSSILSEGTALDTAVYWADIISKPIAFPPEAHTHDWTLGITGKPLTYPPEVHTHSYTDLTDIPTAFTPTGHYHAILDVTGLDTELAGKSNVGHSHAFADITAKPATYPPEAHTHATADITGLNTTLAGKSDVGHAHGWGEITAKPATFTPPIMTGAVRGGALVGYGMKMDGLNLEYLTINSGVGISVNPTTSTVEVNKATLDGWYAKSDQGVTIWKGTQAEYDALGTYDDNTLYFIRE